jgi:hypothetical protein
MARQFFDHLLFESRLPLNEYVVLCIFQFGVQQELQVKLFFIWMQIRKSYYSSSVNAFSSCTTWPLTLNALHLAARWSPRAGDASTRSYR